MYQDRKANLTLMHEIPTLLSFPFFETFRGPTVPSAPPPWCCPCRQLIALEYMALSPYV